MKQYLIALLFICVNSIAFAQDKPPRFSKHAIGTSGVQIYFPAQPTIDPVTYAEDSSKVYTASSIFTYQKTNFNFDAIVVELKNDIKGVEENVLIAYLDYLKSSFKIKQAAGYGKGHTLESHPSAIGVIDFWEAEDGTKWKINGWADANYIVVLFEYGPIDYPNTNIVDVFMKGVRFPGDN